MGGGRQGPLMGRGQSAAGAKLRCSERAWENIKTRSNRRNKGLSENNKGEQHRREGLLVRRCKAMILL